jgi:hypothetical protein
MVEDATSKLVRIETEVNKVIELYDYAEQLYPYSNIREARSVSNK